jgi:crotonobetainyl-CoA:carnitine CoA-transferase CaiB-like acyl-CoA transferase
MRVEIGGAPTGPLSGVRVLDLSTIVSGPLCGQILGDLGADVVKIEAPGGDSARYMGGLRSGDLTGYFAQMNRNKRSVVLDLKSPGGTDALRRLVVGADVLLENFRPDVMGRLGLDDESLRGLNPRLVYASISGFGSEGPYAAQPAYDMVIQALSGIAKTIGSPEAPRLVSNLLADKTAALNAAFAIASALFARERSGVGQRIDIPMLDAFAAFLHIDAIGSTAFGEPPAGPAVGDLLFRAWETRDGHVVALVIEDRQWAAFCRVIEREDMIGDPRFSTLMARMQHAGALIELMSTEISNWTTAEIVARAHAEGTPLAPVHDLADFRADPQVTHSGIVFEQDHPGAGPVPLLRSAPRFSETPSDVRRTAPGLGQHTTEVLTEAGLTQAEIEALGA